MTWTDSICLVVFEKKLSSGLSSGIYIFLAVFESQKFMLIFSIEISIHICGNS
jgi:hypothetical protein